VALFFFALLPSIHTPDQSQDYESMVLIPIDVSESGDLFTRSETLWRYLTYGRGGQECRQRIWISLGKYFVEKTLGKSIVINL
jgi:hypothetical protein